METSYRTKHEAQKKTRGLQRKNARKYEGEWRVSKPSDTVIPGLPGIQFRTGSWIPCVTTFQSFDYAWLSSEIRHRFYRFTQIMDYALPLLSVICKGDCGSSPQ